MKLLAVATGLSLGLLIVACESDGGGDSAGSGSAQPSAEQIGETLADNVCRPRYECGCSSAEGSTLESCKSDIQPFLESFAEEALELGLVYDAECIAGREVEARDMGCKLREEITTFASCSSQACAAFQGTVPLSGACTEFAVGSLPISNCARGLSCREGVCVNPCRDSGVGATCTMNSCDSSLWCRNGICAEHTEVGESCSGEESACGPNAYCTSDARICAEKGAEGDACEFDTCQLGLRCGVNDVCVGRARAGESCAERSCKPTLNCVDFVCTAGLPNGAPCDLIADECQGRCQADSETAPRVCAGGPEPAVCDGT